MESLEIEEPELADEIRKKMFVFEDILLLDDRAIQRVLRSTSLITSGEVRSIVAIRFATSACQNVWLNDQGGYGLYGSCSYEGC